MTISIIIPTYNGSRFIEQSILSALSQTRPADEIIISDDNSNDNTLEICKKYEDRIKIFRNENGPSGFVNGWNNAIALATSDYITILHQDDILAPTFLEEIEEAIVDHPDIMHLFVPCNNIDENGQIFNVPDYCTGEVKIYTGTEYIHAYQQVGKPHIHRCPGVVTHKSIFEKCKYRSEAGHIADDDFFFRVGQFTNVIGILKPLASYRIHRFSETGRLDDSILLKRLLHDYSFQVNHAIENILIDNTALNYFKYWHNKYFIRLIIRGIKNKNISLIIDAFKIYFLKV